MADLDDHIDQIDDDEGTLRKINKKKILIISMPLLVIICIIVGFFTIFNRSTPSSEKISYSVLKKSETDKTSLVFYDLPEVNVQLKGSTSVLRVRMTIELEDERNIPAIEALVSRLTDLIISHTIELTPNEVRGIEGLHWLKEELLYRMNLSTDPVKISSINFKNFEIQNTNKED